MVVEQQSCAHCGLPVPSKFFNPNNPEDFLFCCFGCSLAFQIVHSKTNPKELSWAMVKLGAAVFFAMNVMAFSLALHASSVYPDYAVHLGAEGKAFDELLRYVLFFLSVPVFWLLGMPLAENTIRDLRHRRWTVDGYILIGVAAAFAYSFYATAAGQGALYYDVATMTLAFLSLGRYLEAKYRYQSLHELENLVAQQASSYEVVHQGFQRRVASQDVEEEDEYELRAGEEVPADSEIVSGEATLEMAPMTGEPVPVLFQTGEIIQSGAKVNEGFIRVRAIRHAKQSWLARLRDLIQQAKHSKPPIQNLADRLAVLFTALVSVLFVAAFYLGYQDGGWESAFLRALSVALIACPCALGVAMPLAFWGTFHALGREGVLFRDLERLERLASVKGIFFDKTATLTEPLPILTRISAYNGWTEAQALSLAASVAHYSRHPFSKAIVAAAEKKESSMVPMAQVVSVAGEGISGQCQTLGRVDLGSFKYLERHQIERPVRAEDQALYLCAGGSVVASFYFSEKLRKEALKTLRDFSEQSLHVGILTGDPKGVPAEIRTMASVEVRLGLSPQDKAVFLNEWQKKNGPALIVGEGLNDAPVFSSAAVSLALGGALDAAKECADFILPDDNLSRIPPLVGKARLTLRAVRWNLFWAFLYNAVSIPLSVVGNINPIIAGAAMVLSSFFVISNSLAIRRKGLRGV